MSLNSTTKEYLPYRLPTTVDLFMRIIAFLFFLFAMNSIVDSLELRQKYAKKYKEQNERAGNFHRSRRV